MITEIAYLEALQTVKDYELDSKNRTRALLSSFIDFLREREFENKTRLINILRNATGYEKDMFLDELTKDEFLRMKNTGKKMYDIFEKMKRIEAAENHKNTIKIVKQENLLEQLTVFPNAKDLLKQLDQSMNQVTTLHSEVYKLANELKKIKSDLRQKYKADSVLKAWVKD